MTASPSQWRQQWIYRPHPVLVGLVLVVSLFMLWHSRTPAITPTDVETRGVLVPGTVLRVLSQQDVPRTITSRTTRTQELLVSVVMPDSKERNVTVHNDLTPLSAGDRIYINAMSAGTDAEAFNILDIQRSSGLGWLVAAFVALVLVVAGRKGIGALVGLVFTVAIIFTYLVPAVLGGQDPVIAGLLASAFILVVTFYISYGFDKKSLAALAGVVLTLILVGAVSHWVVGALHFTGFGDENAIYLNQETNGAVDLIGLIVAGIIIAAIGVLDDVAVTQASTVHELAQAGTARGYVLFASAMRVGTDHISGVINTLVLAYAGAALPLILLLQMSHFPLGFSLGGEMIAEEIVRTLLSSAGLVLAVPLTTAIAVVLVDRK